MQSACSAPRSGLQPTDFLVELREFPARPDQGIIGPETGNCGWRAGKGGRGARRGRLAHEAVLAYHACQDEARAAPWG